MNYLQRIVYWSDRRLPFFRLLEERRARWFSQKFLIKDWFPPGSLLVDIGSGVGDVTKTIQSRSGGRVVALDKEDYRRAGNRDLPANDFLLADGEFLPFKSESFDGALLIWALHHMQDPLTVMAETVRVLKRGGALVVVEDLIDEDSKLNQVLVRIYDQFINLELHPSLEHNRSLHGWDSMIRSNFGLKATEVRSLPGICGIRFLRFGLLRYEKE